MTLDKKILPHQGFTFTLLEEFATITDHTIKKVSVFRAPSPHKANEEIKGEIMNYNEGKGLITITTDKGYYMEVYETQIQKYNLTSGL